jgi:hypothetical protein
VQLRLTGEIWYWRGPSPFHFVTVPDAAAADIAAAAAEVSYGWGMIPVTATLGSTRWTTSLWPKDGGYIVPVKTAVRRAEGVELGDTVSLTLTVSDADG